MLDFVFWLINSFEKRLSFQVHTWINAAALENMELLTLDFGYEESENGRASSKDIFEQVFSEDIPHPRTCRKLSLQQPTDSQLRPRSLNCDYIQQFF